MTIPKPNYKSKEPILTTRNGLKIYKRLSTKTPLKSKNPMNKVSKRQKLINEQWSKITNQRIEDVKGICEWCGKPGKRNDGLASLTGHHVIKRRYGINTYANCRCLHWEPCHSFVEKHAINMDIIPNLKAFLELNDKVRGRANGIK